MDIHTQFSPYSLTSQQLTYQQQHQLNITATQTATHYTLNRSIFPPATLSIVQAPSNIAHPFSDPFLTFSLPRQKALNLTMSPTDKIKTIKKATETVVASPIAGRTRTSSTANAPPSLQDIMESLQSFLTLQLASLKTDVVNSVTASVNDRFMDLENNLENNLEHLKSTMDSQQQHLQKELSQVLHRLEAVEQENAVLRGASTSPIFKPTSPTSSHFPSLGSGASKFANTSNQNSQSSQPPHASTASRSTAGALRYFTPVSQNQGFQYLYLPSRGRRPYHEIRALLEKEVKLTPGTVVALHHASSSVVALLVHNDSAASVTELLTKQNLTPIKDFNPYDPRNLGDKAFANAPVAVREAKMKEVVDNQPYVTINFLKRAEAKLAVAHDFHRKGQIPTEYLQDLIHLHGNSRSRRYVSRDQPQQENDHVMHEDQEDEAMEHHSINEDLDHYNTMDSMTADLDAYTKMTSMNTATEPVNTLERQASTGDGEPVAAN